MLLLPPGHCCRHHDAAVAATLPPPRRCCCCHAAATLLLLPRCCDAAAAAAGPSTHQDQSHCTSTGFKTIENRNKPLFLKELKKIWDKEEPNLPWEKGEYTPSNTLLLDDSPYKALRNPPYTAIFPSPYNFQDENDNSLGPEGDLRVYLEGLARSDDVRCYVQKHPFGQHAITSTDPSWPFYLKVIGVENSSGPALCHQGC